MSIVWKDSRLLAAQLSVESFHPWHYLVEDNSFPGFYTAPSRNIHNYAIELMAPNSIQFYGYNRDSHSLSSVSLRNQNGTQSVNCFKPIENRTGNSINDSNYRRSDNNSVQDNISEWYTGFTRYTIEITATPCEVFLCDSKFPRNFCLQNIQKIIDDARKVRITR